MTTIFRCILLMALSICPVATVYAQLPNVPRPSETGAMLLPAGDEVRLTAEEADVRAYTLPFGEEAAAESAAAAPDCPSAPKKPTPNPCAAAYKPVFYNNDFSYLQDTDYSGHCFGDCWKLMPVDNCGRYGTLDVGGQLRMRHHHEVGIGQDVAGPGVQRFEETTHDILLTRFRLYSNWKVSDDMRVFVEGIFAEVTDDDDTYLARPIDVNCGDFLNAFLDYSLDDSCKVRVGRQELLYGAERLISPLDWANTRRTFEGAKLMYSVDDWKIDGFYTHYVPARPYDIDRADYKQPFYGAWGTYSGWEQQTVDLFYIGYDNRHDGDPITTDFSLNTLGSRWYAEKCDWLYELEGGYQFGRQSGLEQDHSAGYGTAGIGRKYSQHPWKPTLWFYFDYASGNFPTGDFNRFNHLFPLGHKYLGYIDAVQRSNIEAPNVLLTFSPTSKWDWQFWFWHFESNSASDIVPSIGGTPNQSTSAKHLGDELDIWAKYKYTARQNFVLGYSHFWRGAKIEAPQDADFFYSHWEMNF